MDLGAELTELFVAEDAPCYDEALRLAAASGLEPVVVGAPALASIASSTTPQGLVAVARSPLRSLEGLPLGDLVLVLAGLRDPGNAGTLVRSACAAEASAVIFTKGSVDPLNPKSVRASAGALFGPPLLASGELGDTLEALRERGLRILGAVAGAEVSVTDADLTGPVALVVGNESRGLSSEPSAGFDALVSIPMPGPAESLNAGIAGSILLYETVRQRMVRLSSADHG